MKTTRQLPAFVWITIGLVLGFLAAYVLFVVSVNRQAAAGASAGETRLAAIERAADTAVSGARVWSDVEEQMFPDRIRIGAGPPTPSGLPDQIHGMSARSGPFEFKQLVLLRLFDWSQLDLGGEPLLRMLLEQGRRHEQVLAAAGFSLIAASGYDEDTWQRQPNPRDEQQRIGVGALASRAWGGTRSTGTAGYLVDVAAPRLVYWRLYATPESAAMVGVRMEYDRASQRLLVEMNYTDRTFAAVKYPAGTWSFVETIKP